LAALPGRLRGAIRAGAPVVLDATKHVSCGDLLRRVPDLDASCRALHLVRDSRGVGYSWTKHVPRPAVMDGEALMTTLSPLRMGGC
jgi:hypothetical protein